MNQFINQPVVNWARHSFPQPVEVKLKAGYQIILGFCFALLALGFLNIPLVFYISAISTFRSEGWNNEVTFEMGIGTIFLAIFGAFALGMFFLIRLIRRRLARVLSVEGVETRGGQRLGWQDLYFLNYTKGSTHTRVRPRNVNKTVLESLVGELIFSFVKAALFAGVKNIRVEMVFANGKAVVPTLIQNQPQILALLYSIPVQQRIGGKITQ